MGAEAGPAQSRCSVDIAHIAAGRPSSAPSAMAPLGLLGEAHPRIRSLWDPLDPQILTQDDIAAAGMEIKALIY